MTTRAVRPFLVRLDLHRLGWVLAGTWWSVSLLFQLYLYAAYPIMRETLFVDARLYRLASLAWLEGGNPWADLGLHPYAAPPPDPALHGTDGVYLG